MAKVTIVYWRAIPAQVIVREGRRTARRQLSERFEKAIDKCAMRVGARDTDAYLAEWRRAEPIEAEGDPEALADEWARRLESEFDEERLGALVASGGWEKANA